MTPEFDCNVGGQIPNTRCENFAIRYQKSDKHFDVNWAYIGKNTLLELLGQNPADVAGIKIIPGLDASNNPQIMLSSVTKDGHTIVSYDILRLCPPFCQDDWKLKLNGKSRTHEFDNHLSPV